MMSLAPAMLAPCHAIRAQDGILWLLSLVWYRPSYYSNLGTGPKISLSSYLVLSTSVDVSFKQISSKEI